ncbi:14166_t:CDS:2 [Acaulospora colombiana]|uniref:14166_t:CDS:1 n=1 Tax=Acaulospora colombiana TaxID=27376 RepID=A0ACA9KR59_9GLOM|nr:14166_t:CDS:2 [Acaulospora colombiana]
MRFRQAPTCIRSNCNKPAYVEVNGIVHPYCSKTCASVYTANVRKCSNTWCNKLRYVEADGTVFAYCGKTCARTQTKCARNGCNRGRYTQSSDRTKFYLFCNPACYWSESDNLTSTKITSLSPSNLKYVHVYQQFLSMMSQARIQGILLLQMPKNIVRAHDNLKKGMSISGTRLHRMYHGTKSLCDPGKLITNRRPSCKSGCGVCGIIKEGNNNHYSHDRTNMWFARNPATSNSYTGGHVNKAIFCVDVISSSAPTDFIIVNSNPVIQISFFFTVILNMLHKY